MDFYNMPVAYLLICFVTSFHVTECSETFNYENHYKFAPGRKIIPSYRRMLFQRHEYPEPLPSTKNPIASIRSPYRSIYQGSRRKNDTRVFRRKFNFEAQPSGHQILCEGTFDCIISHIAVETTHGIPILIRGGAGYHYFRAVAKAKAGEDLVGTVRVYCKEMDTRKFLKDVSNERDQVFRHRNYESDIV